MPQTTTATDDPPPVQAVDYAGHPLTEGATVAFINNDPITLCQGRIRVIGPRQICIDTGHDLYVFDGTHSRITLAPQSEGIPVYDSDGPTGLYLGNKRITGGTVVGTLPDESQAPAPLRYPHVALQAAKDAA